MTNEKMYLLLISHMWIVGGALSGGGTENRLLAFAVGLVFALIALYGLKP